jgi:hypothetical protein
MNCSRSFERRLFQLAAIALGGLALVAGCGGSGKPSTPPAANVSFMPGSAMFPAQAVGTTSATTQITIKNDSNGTMNMLALNILGADATQFKFAMPHTCTGTLARGGTCVGQLQFAPTSPGAKTATLEFATGASKKSIPVTGTAVRAAAITVMPASHDYGLQVIGTESAPFAFMVKNEGGMEASMVTVTTPSEFPVKTNNCPTTLGPNATCEVTIAFAPTTAGPRNVSGAVSSTDSLFRLELVGNGTARPTVSASPASVTFPPTAVGKTSAAQVIRLMNTTPVAITGLKLGASMDVFKVGADTCMATMAAGGTIPANGMCEVSVTFAPTAAQEYNGALNLTLGNGMASAVPLSGKGLRPGFLKLGNTEVPFGSIAINTDSPKATVTLSNTGEEDVTGITVALAGPDMAEFKLTNNCGGTLTVGTPAGTGSTCNIEIVYHPTNEGPSQVSLNVTSTNGGSPSAAVTGTGVVSVLSITPNSQAFGTVTIGATSGPFEFAVKNNGTAAAGALTITKDSEFETVAGGADACVDGTPLAGGATCKIILRFKPTTPGQKNTPLTVMATPGGSISAMLTGLARSPARLTLDKPSQLFGSVALGQTSNDIPFIVTNSGDEPSGAPTITTGSPQFVIGANACQNNALDPNETCTFQVRFAPSVVGMATATLTVAATGSANATADLSGVGIAPADLRFQNGAGVNLSVQSFAETVVGQQTSSVTVFVRNVGQRATGTLTTALGGTDMGDFVIVTGSNTCGPALAAGAVCSMQLLFKPTAAGDRSAKVTVTDTVSGGLAELLLDGTGAGQIQIVRLDGANEIKAPTHDFGERSAGTMTALTFRVKAITASGTYTVTLDPGGSPPNFVRTGGTCNGTNIPAGGDCTVIVTFTPQLPTGAKMGRLQVITSDNRMDSVGLTGTAAGPLTFTPAPHGFGSLPTGAQVTQDFKLKNNNGVQPVTGLVITLPGDGDFTIAENLCGATLAANDECTVRVRFLAGAPGAKTGTLTANGSYMAGGAPVATSATAALTATVTVAAQITASLNPTEFGTVPVGAPPVTRTVTISNASGAPTTGGVTIGAFPPDYTMTRNGCLASDNVTPRPLAGGENCTFDVRFSPSATGQRSGAVLVTASPGGTVSVQLNGAGDPTLAISPAVKDLDIDTSTNPDTAVLNVVGATNKRFTFTITNRGAGTLTTVTPTIESSTAVGATPDGKDYFGIFQSAAMPCMGTLTAGASCNVDVAMVTPGGATPGEKFARLQVTTGVVTTTASSEINGTLLADAALSFTDAAPRAFGGVLVGMASSSHLIQVRNTGGVTTGALALGPLGTSFRQMPTTGTNTDTGNRHCEAGLTLAPNTTCDLLVQFTPTAAGAASANVTVWVPAGFGSSSASALSPLTKALSGTGIAATGTIYLTPTPVDLGGAAAGAGAAVTKVVTLNNQTGMALTMGGVTLLGPAAGFSVASTTCPATGMTLAAGTPCTITIGFQPAGGATPGNAADVLQVIATPGAGAAQTVQAALTGTVLAPAALRIESPSEGANWGDALVNIAAAKRVFVIRNIGGVATGSAPAATTNAEFAIATGDNMCTAALAPNATCTVSVTLTPTAIGARTATFTATATATTAATPVTLNANGVLPSAIQVVSIGGTATAMTTVAFGSKAILSETGIDVVIRNAADAQKINVPTFTLQDQQNFRFDTNAGVANDCFDRVADGLAGGEDCNLRIFFRPQPAMNPGALSTTLIVGGATTNLTLTLTGTSVSALSITGNGALGSTAVNATSADAVFTIANSGDSGTPMTGPVSVAIGGVAANDYRIKANTCTGAGLAAGASCTVTVVFEPKSTGLKNATLSATASPTNGATVALTGTGT